MSHYDLTRKIGLKENDKKVPFINVLLKEHVRINFFEYGKKYFAVKSERSSELPQIF